MKPSFHKILFPGLLLIGLQTLIVLLSQQSGLGQHDTHFIKVIYFVGLELISAIIFFHCVQQVLRMPAEETGGLLGWIFFIAVAIRFLFLFSQPILETDPYRYIWDGQMLNQGYNPYLLAPQDAFAIGLLDSAHPEEVLHTFEKINHAGIRTIYPPMAQLFFVTSQIFSPWNLWGLRALIFLSEIFSLLMIILLLQRAGQNENRLLIYGWCPLIIKEFSNSLHVDAFVIPWLLVALFLLQDKRLVGAVLCVTCAALTKGFSLIFLPLILVMGREEGVGSVVKSLLAFAGVFLLFHLPFLDMDLRMFEGLWRFAGEWQVNAGLFTVWETVWAQFLPTQTADLFARLTSGVLLGGLLIKGVYELYRKPAWEEFLRWSIVLLAGVFFLAPTGNPWYFTWLFAFLVFKPVKPMIFFSALVFLYYLLYGLRAAGQAEAFVWIQWLEYGSLAGVLLREYYVSRRGEVQPTIDLTS